MLDFRTLPAPLIVSCQAPHGSPLRDAGIMAAIAEAAVAGGAAAIRANSPEHVRAIKERVAVPVIGLFKQLDEAGNQWITPTPRHAQELAEAGADAIAIDATLRPRPYSVGVSDLIAYIRDRLRITVLADVDSTAAGIAAESAGADAVASTLSGYTVPDNATSRRGPDVELVRDLRKTLHCPVIAEGRYATAWEIAQALAVGAAAVVVGSAITNPTHITSQLLTAAIHGNARTG